jgi:HSP20 family molecular chaperone IbpA
MAIKDLIPWNNKEREVGFQRATDVHPFLALHREMNRMFDEVFRGFDVAPFGLASRALDGLGWPQIDIEDTDKEVRITAELPGLDEKDVSVEIANGVLSISGEKKSESEEQVPSLQRTVLRSLRTAHIARRSTSMLRLSLSCHRIARRSRPARTGFSNTRPVHQSSGHRPRPTRRDLSSYYRSGRFLEYSWWRLLIEAANAAVR